MSVMRKDQRVKAEKVKLNDDGVSGDKYGWGMRDEVNHELHEGKKESVADVEKVVEKEDISEKKVDV